ncbi:MAG: hypothetical protein ACTII7_09720 [Galactobacter sp.]
MSEANPPTATKFFKTRIDQELIGRWLNGDKIPGGPYTITQVVLGFCAGAIGLWTKTRLGWSTGNVLMDAAIIVGLVVGVIYLLKTVVPEEPGLLKMRTFGYANATMSLTAPTRSGSYRGAKYNTRPVKHRRTGRVLIDLRPTTLPPTAPAPAPVKVAVAETRTDAPTRGVSGLQHLLATTRH